MGLVKERMGLSCKKKRWMKRGKEWIEWRVSVVG